MAAGADPVEMIAAHLGAVAMEVDFVPSAASNAGAAGHQSQRATSVVTHESQAEPAAVGV